MTAGVPLREAGSLNRILTTCPICGDRLSVARLHCRSCDTSIEGHFDLGRLGRLSQEQVAFVEAFVRCEGKFNRLERELGLSYPTLRSRLSDIIGQMGFEVGPESGRLSEDARRRVLDDLAKGKLTSEQAMHMLEGD